MLLCWYSFSVSRSNKQKNRKKSPPLLPTQDRERKGLDEELENASLNQTDYEKVLSLWVEEGSNRWLPIRIIGGEQWRRRFIGDLKEKRQVWRELIRKGTKRPNSLDKEDIDYWLILADGDPLMFLNLAGTPPLKILCELEKWSSGIETMNRLREGFRSKAFVDDIKLLKKAVRVVDKYQPLIRTYIDFTNYLYSFAEQKHRDIEYKPVSAPKNLPDSNSLEPVMKIIQNAQEIGLAPPGIKERGGPPKVEFPHIVKVLAVITTKESWPVKESKIHWGAITALLMAAFPKWFKGANDPIRNVKNAYNADPFKWGYFWWSEEEKQFMWGQEQHLEPTSFLKR